MWTSCKKEIIWVVGIFVIVIFYTNQVFTFLDQTNIPKMATVALSRDVVEPNIRLAFVGDVMLDRGVEWSVNKNFAGDYRELFTKVKSQLQSYDLLLANLEGPVSDKGTDQGGKYSFRMDPLVSPILAEAGFDVFSLANNHILNYGSEALADTKVRLTENNLNIAGEKTILLKGVKVMILPYNQFSNLKLEEMKKEIALAKLTNDLVIIYFHFGDEYQVKPNAYQTEVARSAIEAGADLVVGAHPHVVQTLDQYKNVWIAYSLGNFVFDQYFSEQTMQGGLLEVEINPKSKQIEKVFLKKVNLNKFYQVESIE